MLSRRRRLRSSLPLLFINLTCPQLLEQSNGRSQFQQRHRTLTLGQVSQTSLRQTRQSIRCSLIHSILHVSCMYIMDTTFFFQRLHKRFYIEKAKRDRKKEFPHVTPKIRVCREAGWGPFCFYFRNMHLLLFFGTCAVSVWCVCGVSLAVSLCGPVPTVSTMHYLSLLIFRLCGWVGFCGTGTMTLVSLPMLSQSRDARGRSLARCGRRLMKKRPSIPHPPSPAGHLIHPQPPPPTYN